ncbi:3'-5' exonuclease (plasmid) [Pseudomonas sp. WOUb67]|uniref:3'-5' exonuclease n=1 Tax=Pseudomonas sp. WOUb67 TaxID=3161136 RepID=UPI003CF92E7C
MARQRVHLTPAEAAANGWLCQKDLKAHHRLMIGHQTQPAGTVWQGQGAYNVYKPADCVPYRWQPGPAQVRRQLVAAHAQELIGGNCLVLDTETTGVGRNDEVCEITIIDASGAVLLDTLVRPTQPIPAEARAIHRITDAMVANAPSWPELAEQYAAITADRTVVMYNAAFDKRLLSQTHALHGLTAPALTTSCAMLLYSEWDGQYDRARDSWMWRKLIEAADECGVWEEGAHRAHADARMTLGVLRYLEQRTSGRRPRKKP